MTCKLPPATGNTFGYIPTACASNTKRKTFLFRVCGAEVIEVIHGTRVWGYYVVLRTLLWLLLHSFTPAGLIYETWFSSWNIISQYWVNFPRPSIHPANHSFFQSAIQPTFQPTTNPANSPSSQKKYVNNPAIQAASSEKETTLPALWSQVELN